ncbi:YdcF family protein [Nocardia sp. NPDC003963]
MFRSYTGSGRHRRPTRIPTAIRAGLTSLLATAALGMTLSGNAGATPPPGPAGDAGLIDALTGPLARPHGPDTAIVILGYGLRPDGSMRPELVDRLRAGYIQALLAPRSPVIVTGGNPRNGVTEAAAMADWLIARGIPPQRVHQENAAATTVQNARNSAALVHALGARDAVVVTSPDHIGRAARNFVAAGIPVTATLTPHQIPDFVAALTPDR